jgi:hypothetical protein
MASKGRIAKVFDILAITEFIMSQRLPALASFRQIYIVERLKITS